MWRCRSSLLRSILLRDKIRDVGETDAHRRFLATVLHVAEIYSTAAVAGAVFGLAAASVEARASSVLHRAVRDVYLQQHAVDKVTIEPKPVCGQPVFGGSHLVVAVPDSGKQE